MKINFASLTYILLTSFFSCYLIRQEHPQIAPPLPGTFRNNPLFHMFSLNRLHPVVLAYRLSPIASRFSLPGKNTKRRQNNAALKVI